MKFKIEVQMEDMFEQDGEGNCVLGKTFEEAIFEKVVRQITEKAQATIQNRILEDAGKIIDQATKDTLTSIVSGIFEQKIDVTDEWGNKKFKGTIKDRVTAQFSAFLTEKVDKEGRVGYGATMTRTEWLSKKILEKEVESFTKDTVETLKKGIKEKLTADLQAAVGTEIINSIGVKKVIDRLQLSASK